MKSLRKDRFLLHFTARSGFSLPVFQSRCLSILAACGSTENHAGKSTLFLHMRTLRDLFIMRAAAARAKHVRIFSEVGKRMPLDSTTPWGGRFHMNQHQSCTPTQIWIEILGTLQPPVTELKPFVQVLGSPCLKRFRCCNFG